jgi:hypothetical protein
MESVISQNLQIETVIYLLLGLFALVLCMQIYLFYKISHMEQQQKAVFKGIKGADLEAMLLNNWESINHVLMESKELKEKVELLEFTNSRNVRRIGLTRYDAFKECSGNMSYSLALLNDSGTGVVITGIFTQEQGRSYVKAVRNWAAAETPLTEEEEKAIKLAYKDNGAVTH